MSYLESATSAYEKHLDKAGPYLTRRGISRELAVQFRLGVAVDPFPEHDHWRNRLVIPYLTVNGPLALKARCIESHDCKETGHGKYFAENDAPPLLYNAPDLLKDEDTLYVCEGELDALVLSGGLGLAAVAYPGTAAWRAYFNRAIGPDWARIVVIADGDDPGRDAARSVAKHLRARVCRLPDGEDSSSLYVKEGADALRARLVGFTETGRT